MPEQITNPISSMRTTLASETETITPQDNGEVQSAPVETPDTATPEPDASVPDDTDNVQSDTPDAGDDNTPAPLNEAFAKADFSEFQKRRDIAQPEVIKTPAATVKQKVTVPPKDYTGIDEADKPHFEQMSNSSFLKQKEIYLENRKLKEEMGKLKTAAPTIQKTWDHPEAYKLDPEYATATKQLEVAQGIENHLVTQLERIAEGEKWQDLEVDPKTGQVYVSQTQQEPNIKSEQYLRKLLTQTQAEAVKVQSKITDMSQTYTRNYQQDVAVIKAAEEKYFPGYDDEKHPTRATQEAFINNILPASMRSNPLAKVLAKTVANNHLFKTEAETWKKKFEELEAKVKSAKPSERGVQPTTRNIAPGTAKSNGKTDITYEMFQNRRMGI